MLRTLFIFTAAASAFAAGPVVADVYKFKDEKGNVLYTDKPTRCRPNGSTCSRRRRTWSPCRARQEEMQRLQDADKASQQATQPARTRQQAAS